MVLNLGIVFQRYCSAVSPPRFAVSSTSVNTVPMDRDEPRRLCSGNLARQRFEVLVGGGCVGLLRAAISRASFTRSLDEWTYLSTFFKRNLAAKYAATAKSTSGTIAPKITPIWPYRVYSPHRST